MKELENLVSKLECAAPQRLKLAPKRTLSVGTEHRARKSAGLFRFIRASSVGS